MRALERQYKTAGKTGTGGASAAGERVGLVLTGETRQADTSEEHWQALQVRQTRELSNQLKELCGYTDF